MKLPFGSVKYKPIAQSRLDGSRIDPITPMNVHFSDRKRHDYDSTWTNWISETDRGDIS